MRPILPILAGLAALAAGCAPGVGAQQRPGGGAAVPDGAGPAIRVALYSAVLPGAGQHTLGQRRAWAYHALEALGWAIWLDRRSEASDYRARYRSFAWERARIQAGTRRDGDFEYYERMSNWERSGAFDGDAAAPGVQPEPDPSTYNGTIWERARQLFMQGAPSLPESDPRYQAALAYYGDRAYGPEFLWDWTGTGGARDEFGALIRASDDRFRQATNAVGFVLANHLISAVDAFVSARAGGAEVRSALLPSRFGEPTWSTRVRVPIGW